MITAEQIAKMDVDTVFKTVIMKTPVVTGKNEELIFCAVKGGGPGDWAIYATRPRRDLTLIQNIDMCSGVGDKIHTKSLIIDIVPCDDEAYRQYRF